MNTVDYAKQYASRGWPVFRIRPNSKVPIDRWVKGPTFATCDQDVIATRFAHTGYNIGIATGHEMVGGGYLTVLDLDTDEPGYQGRPDWAVKTYEVWTPSGGLHLYYRTEEPVRSGRIASGIDVKSRGGMVLAPPSSINGRCYRRPNALEELAWVAVPRFYIVKNQGTVSSPYETSDLPLSQPGNKLKAPADIMPGERNSQLMANGSAIYAVAESPEAARYTLETFNQMMPHPLSPREVKNIADWLEAKENWL